MERVPFFLFPFVFSAALSVVLAAWPSAERPRPTVVWFAPAPGSLDMLRLFQADAEWAAARSRMAVFKFYVQHLQDPAPPLVGPNTYRNLVAVDAFRTVTRVWHKRLAIEAGAVKEHYCTADASGMDASIRDTLAAISRVQGAGGVVSFLAMDEPFLAGQSVTCGGPDLAPTLQRLQRYCATVLAAAPNVRIGLIEAYPHFSAGTLAGFIASMADRGIAPAFFHLDVDLNALRTRDTFAADLPLLAAECEKRRIPFGVIVWGESGDSDPLYVEQAMRIVHRVNESFPGVLPQIVFQSWAESHTGLRITPTNLPETTANTHTWLIDAGLSILTRPR